MDPEQLKNAFMERVRNDPEFRDLLRARIIGEPEPEPIVLNDVSPDMARDATATEFTPDRFRPVRPLARLAEGTVKLGRTALELGRHIGFDDPLRTQPAIDALQEREELLREIAPPASGGIGSMIDMVIRDAPAFLMAEVATGPIPVGTAMQIKSATSLGGRTAQRFARGAKIGAGFEVASGDVLEEGVTGVLKEALLFGLLDAGPIGAISELVSPTGARAVGSAQRQARERAELLTRNRERRVGGQSIIDEAAEGRLGPERQIGSGEQFAIGPERQLTAAAEDVPQGVIEARGEIQRQSMRERAGSPQMQELVERLQDPEATALREAVSEKLVQPEALPIEDLAPQPPPIPQTPGKSFNLGESIMSTLNDTRGGVAFRPDPLSEAIGAPAVGLPEYSSTIRSRISNDLGTKRPTVWERVEDLYTGLVKGTQVIKSTEKDLAGGAVLPSQRSPYAAARIAQGSSRRAEGFLEIGPVRWTEEGNLEAIEGVLSYRQIQDMAGDIAALNEYEIAARALEVAKRDIDIGVPLDAARKSVAAVRPEVRQAHVEKVKYRRAVRDYAADAGMFSPEAVAAMDRLGEEYVPLFRVFAGKDPMVRGAGQIGTATRIVRQLKGSKRKILNPVYSDIDYTQRLIRAADRQRVSKLLVELAEANPENAIGIIEQVGSKKGRQGALNKESARLKVSMEARGIEVTDDVAIELAEQLSDAADRAFINGEFTLWRDGQIRRYRVDPRLANGLAALSPTDVGGLVRLMGLPVSMFKAGITLDPGFSGFNFIRDAFDATIQTKYGFRPSKGGSFKGFFESAKANWLGTTSKAYEEFVLAGGGFASLRGGRTRSIKAMASRIAPNQTPAARISGKILHPVEALKTFAQPFEEAARIGEFLKARNAGDNVISALVASQDITINFLEQGAAPTMRALNMMVPFLNPAIQSMDRSFKVMTGDHWQRAWIASFSSISLPSAYFWVANRNDQEITDLRKTNAGLLYWFYRTPSDEIVRIPKPFLYGQIFGTGMEAVLDRLADEDPEALERWAQGIRDQSTAQLLPQLLNIYMEQKSNEDTFFKTPIVPRGKERLDPELQVQSFTGETARRLGKMFNVSPARLEAVWSDITGTLGRKGLQGVDLMLRRMEQEASGEAVSPPAPELADLPVIGRLFARRASAMRQPVQKFYEVLGDAEQKWASYNQFVESDPDRAASYGDEHAELMALLPVYRASTRNIRELRTAIDDLNKIH